jgi:hypothetical protein
MKMLGIDKNNSKMRILVSVLMFYFAITLGVLYPNVISAIGIMSGTLASITSYVVPGMLAIKTYGITSNSSSLHSSIC